MPPVGQPASRLYRPPPSPAINNTPLSDAPRWVSQHHGSIDHLCLQLPTHHSVMPPVGQPTSQLYRPPPSPAINNRPLSDAPRWVSQHHGSTDRFRLQLTTHHSVMPPVGQPASQLYRPPPSPDINNTPLSDSPGRSANIMAR